jgi:hypothetical protein
MSLAPLASPLTGDMSLPKTICPLLLRPPGSQSKVWVREPPLPVPGAGSPRKPIV